MVSAVNTEQPKKQNFQERLAEYAQQFPNGTLAIRTEIEAAELLLAVAAVLKLKSDLISHPIQLEQDKLDPWRKNFNKKERLKVVQMANRFRRQAANGTALMFCQEEFGHTPLEYLGLAIVFPKDK